jgi:dienelactone hydrolase
MTFRIDPVPPTGRLSVGVTTSQLVDSSRGEMFSDEIPPRRELALQIWYPAAPTANAKPLSGTSAFPWGSLICPPKSMAVSEYPHFFERIVDLVQIRSDVLKWPKLTGEINSHSFPHTPLMKAASPYPVILFSHGNGGFLAQTSYLMEELASHGYVVIAISHTYNAWLTSFPDGRIIPADFEHPIYKAIEEQYSNSQAILEQIKKNDSLSFRQQRSKELYHDGEYKKLMPNYFELLQTRCDDLRFTIDELHRLENNANWRFAGALDLGRLAVLGYSLGGEAASQTCVIEERIRAGVALDSDLWGNMFGQSIKQPFFCIYAESNERDTEYVDRTSAIIIGGTKHASFSSNAYWWESQGRTDIKGTLATSRCHEITRQYVLAFLNHYLNTITDDILNEATVTIPEVRYLAAPLV